MFCLIHLKGSVEFLLHCNVLESLIIVYFLNVYCESLVWKENKCFLSSLSGQYLDLFITHIDCIKLSF